MKLSDVEKCILVADRDFRSTQDKLDYVNTKLHYAKPNEKESELQQKVILEPFPGCKNKIIKRDRFYRLLGNMNKKARERGHEIRKNMLPDLVNECDTLIEDRKDVRDLLGKAILDKKLATAERLKRLQIDLGRRILAIKEQVSNYVETPDIEDADQLERQIQLLTSS